MLVAQGVVDHLEAVEVADDYAHGEGAAFLQPPQFLLEERAVVKPGESVVRAPVPQLVLHLLALADVADALDRPEQVSFLVADRGREGPEMKPPAAVSAGGKTFADKNLALPLDFLVLLLPLLAVAEQDVHEDGPAFPVKRDGVGVFAPAQHFFLPDSRHFFHGPVPHDHPAFAVDGKDAVRKEIDDPLDKAKSLHQSFRQKFAAFNEQDLQQSPGRFDFVFR